MLRQLPDWCALVIRSNLSPLVVRFRPAWRRLDARLGLCPLPDLRPAELHIPDAMLEAAREAAREAVPERELIGSVNGHRQAAAAEDDR